MSHSGLASDCLSNDDLWKLCKNGSVLIKFATKLLQQKKFKNVEWKNYESETGSKRFLMDLFNTLTCINHVSHW